MSYPEIQEALKELLDFHPEDQHLDRDSDFYEAGDERAPFFSEAYLYNLLGKDDARSVLIGLRRVCKAAGMGDSAL